MNGFKSAAFGVLVLVMAGAGVGTPAAADDVATPPAVVQSADEAFAEAQAAAAAEPGGAGVYLKEDAAGGLVWYGGSTVGWPRGTIHVRVRYRTEGGDWHPWQAHTCTKSTWCSTPDYSTFNIWDGIKYFAQVEGWRGTNTAVKATAFKEMTT